VTNLARPAERVVAFYNQRGTSPDWTLEQVSDLVLQDPIGARDRPKQPLARPPHKVRRYYASFSYQAQSWKKPRRVVAKIEWQDLSSEVQADRRRLPWRHPLPADHRQDHAS
jgi:hypothetical protein